MEYHEAKSIKDFLNTIRTDDNSSAIDEFIEDKLLDYFIKCHCIDIIKIISKAPSGNAPPRFGISIEARGGRYGTEKLTLNQALAHMDEVIKNLRIEGLSYWKGNTGDGKIVMKRH